MDIVLVTLKSGHRALIGRGEGVAALAAALGVSTHLKEYGGGVERDRRIIGARDYTSGPQNGTHAFTAPSGATFAWHYRRGWLSQQPTPADFGV